MANDSSTSLSLQLMINKEYTKVLFAEANLYFVNVLLSFLAVPLGKLQHSGISLGSINTLWRALISMDESYFCMPGCKDMLLNPRSSLGALCRKLALDITDSPPNTYYVCEDEECREKGALNVSIYCDIATCDCGRPLNREVHVPECREGGVFVNKPSSFIITDDLRVVPVLTGISQTLSDLGITLPRGVTREIMTFDKNEMKKLLNVSLTSATPLTDMMLKKTETSTAATKGGGMNITLQHIPKKLLPSRKIMLKGFLQKSTDKFLYAEATEEFVELLFSFLALPLGGVEFLLGGKTGFKNIDNLYRSVSNGIDDKCFRTPDTKSSLTNPKLPYGSNIFTKQFLPLCLGTLPGFYYKTDSRYDPVIKHTTFYETDNESDRHSAWRFKESKAVYVRKHSKFIVTDDLRVSPDLVRSILILSRLGISFSDVEEMELSIGLEEALRILKTCLTSKTVLTDVLVNPVLNELFERRRR